MYVRGDLRNAFIGNPQDIIEWIQTGRDEVAGALTWDPPDKGIWQLRAGMANQTQISEYEGGADYSNLTVTAWGIYDGREQWGLIR